jgi:hypothetical protein
VFIDEMTKTVSVEINANAIVDNLARLFPHSGDLGSLYFVALTLSDSKGKEIDRNVQWFQKEMKWGDLAKLVPAKIEIDFVSATEEKDENVYHFTVKNLSSAPAVNVFLELINGYQGQEILPSFWSNNALTLVPNERTDVEVRVRKSSILKSPHLIVEGLNVAPREIDFLAKTESPLSLQVTDFELKRMEGKKYIAFSAASKNAAGERINSFQFPVKINGELLRNVIAGCKAGSETSGMIDIEHLPAGEYSVETGNLKKEIVIE